MSKFTSLFLRNNQDAQIGEDFRAKLNNVKKYYIDEPGLDPARFNIFADFLNFITREDLELLVYGYVQKHRLDPAYDVSNVKVIEDVHDMRFLKSYLEKIGTLKKDESIKLILKIKKGEPAHYQPNLGVHVIPIYIRHEGDTVSVFLMDNAAGVVLEKRDGFDNMLTILNDHLRSCYGDNYRIIKSSAITMADARNCPMYALSTLHYFIKQGHLLFQAITKHLVSQQKKVFDQDDPKIYHLKADALPAALVKMTNRRNLKRMNDGYNHEWMPVKVTLSKNYATHRDFVSPLMDKPVGKTQQKTLKKYLELNSESRRTQQGKAYKYNLTAERKMRNARRNILWMLQLNGVVNHSENAANTIDPQQLANLFSKVRMER
jgi:hypothetical protein